MMASVSRILAFCALAAVSAAGAVHAAQWPDRPVKLIVPFTPGGGTDMVARAVAAKLGESIGQTVVVENRPGAGGTLGSHLVAKAAPDGYTIGIATSSTHVTSAILKKDTPYDPVKDFAPITEIGSTPYVLVISPDFPAHNLKEFIVYVKAHPTKVDDASVGRTTLGYLISEMFKLDTGIKMLHVPYKGSSQVYPDLMSNRVSAFFDNPVASSGFVKTGKLRALGVTQRTAVLPDTPSFVELGMKDFNAVFWYGLVAPAGTPEPIVASIQSSVAKFVQSPEGQAKFAKLAVKPVGDTPQQFTATIRSDIARWRKVADAAGIKPE